MRAMSPRIRFFVIIGISVFVTIGFIWYNYGIVSEITNAEGVIKVLDGELRAQDQVRQNIVDTQARREILISGLESASSAMRAPQRASRPFNIVLTSASERSAKGCM